MLKICMHNERKLILDVYKHILYNIVFYQIFLLYLLLLLSYEYNLCIKTKSYNILFEIRLIINYKIKRFNSQFLKDLWFYFFDEK